MLIYFSPLTHDIGFTITTTTQLQRISTIIPEHSQLYTVKGLAAIIPHVTMQNILVQIFSHQISFPKPYYSNTDSGSQGVIYCSKLSSQLSLKIGTLGRFRQIVWWRQRTITVVEVVRCGESATSHSLKTTQSIGGAMA